MFSQCFVQSFQNFRMLWTNHNVHINWSDDFIMVHIRIAMCLQFSIILSSLFLFNWVRSFALIRIMWWQIFSICPAFFGRSLTLSLLNLSAWQIALKPLETRRRAKLIAVVCDTSIERESWVLNTFEDYMESSALKWRLYTVNNLRL